MRKYCQVLRLVETIGRCFLWSAVEKVRSELLIYSVTTFIDFFFFSFRWFWAYFERKVSREAQLALNEIINANVSS